MRIASHFAHCKNSAGGNDCFPKQQALTVAGVWVAHRVGTSNTMQFQFHHHQMASSRVKKQQLHTHTHLYYTYLKHLETAKYSRCYKEDNVERIQQITLKGDSRRTLSIWVLSARKPSTSMGRLPTKSCMELSFTRGRTTINLAQFGKFSSNAVDNTFSSEFLEVDEAGRCNGQLNVLPLRSSPLQTASESLPPTIIQTRFAEMRPSLAQLHQIHQQRPDPKTS